MKKFIILILFLISIKSIGFAQTKIDSINQIIILPDFKKNSHGVFGYTINIPNQFIGLYGGKFDPDKTSFYFEIKTSTISSISSKDEFYESISVNKAENIYGDKLIDTDKQYSSVNLCFTNVLSNHVLFFAGVGLSFIYSYKQYKDELEILGKHGEYWIEEKSETKINILFGIIFPLNDKMGLSLGYQIEPSGLNIGINIISEIR